MLITLTTDFGYDDPFVGIMKGVILRINPGARIVDISHGIRPQDISAAALVLKHSVSYFPPSTIHLAIVDPGVGSDRRPILIECQDYFLVGPDNGVLSLALAGREPRRVIRLSNPEYFLKPTSMTFHGRDVFAPVAAHLSLGTAPTALGDTVEEFVKLSLPTPVKLSDRLEGEILYTDGFGNLVTNIQEADLAKWISSNVQISCGPVSIAGIVRTYSNVPEGAYAALINSWGLLEIGIFKGSARERTGAARGDKVQIVAVSEDHVEEN